MYSATCGTVQEGVKQMLLAMQPLTSLHSLNLGGNRVKVCVNQPIVCIVCLQAFLTIVLKRLCCVSVLSCVLQDNVDKIVVNHPLLEELDLPHAHLKDSTATLLLSSIKQMQMLRLVTLTDNYISEAVVTTLGEELPHVLVVFDDMDGEMDEVLSLDGDDELEDGEGDDGVESDDEDGSDDEEDDDDTGTDEDTDSETDSYSDSSDTEDYIDEQDEN